VNERLRSAMATRGISVDTLAGHAGVDAKTIERWLLGRTPHPRHRWSTAALLREDETYLWPETTDSRRTATASRAELVRLYPRRGDVPLDLWWQLFVGAKRHVDVLVYAAAYLPEQHPGLIALLREKGREGCRVRVALGDFTSPIVLARGQEEGYDDGETWIASRIRLALLHYQPLAGSPGTELRLHGTVLYNSIFRFDDAMLVNTHVYGHSAPYAPVMHLRRLDGGLTFDTYVHSFELVWASARPYAPAPVAARAESRAATGAGRER
jgi:transcriptional regulator with XRE-family HTH domain